MYPFTSKLLQAIQNASCVAIHKPGRAQPYHFRHYPFGERGTFITPELMEEIAEGLACMIADGGFSDFDYIASPEPGGHTWGMLAALKVKKPINILRMSIGEKYEEFKICVRRETAYNFNYIYYENFKPGDRVLIVDDVISSGGTICGIAEQLGEMGVEVVGIQAILVKDRHYEKIGQKYGFPVRYLARVDTKTNEVFLCENEALLPEEPGEGGSKWQAY